MLTADIITPPVDDARLFGQIAAANAMSDVYAMGGRPLACLNLLGFPSGKLDHQVLADIIAGAAEKISEAGAVLAGGHTTEDDEPKFGLSVTGLVHPHRFWANRGARPGDVLILTKPIGTGLLLNANLKGQVSARALGVCLEALTTLNKVPAEVLQGFEVHAVTDVTGFGLAGHALEMARASDVTLVIETDAVPVFPEALAVSKRGTTTGSTRANRQMAAPSARFERSLPGWHEDVFFDPQTSGGLLACVAPDVAAGLLAALHGASVADARRIGTVEPPDGECRLVFR